MSYNSIFYSTIWQFRAPHISTPFPLLIEFIHPSTHFRLYPFIRCSELPCANRARHRPYRRVQLVMEKADDLLYEYIQKGHKSCPLLWNKAKWKNFMEQKVIEAIVLLTREPEMNLPYGFNYFTRNLPMDLA